MKTSLKTVLLAVTIAVGLSSAAAPSSAQEADAQAIVDRAKATVESMRAAGSGEAIGALLAKAHGVFVYPQILKAGFILGGEGGTGVLLGRDDHGSWSDPAFYTLAAASFGLQIGVESSSAMLIIMNRKTLDKAIGTGLELGTDASVAALTAGAKTELLTTNQLQDIYYFAQIQGGVFAGINLKGATVLARDGLNEAYYGKGAKPQAIVIDRSLRNPGALNLITALSR